MSSDLWPPQRPNDDRPPSAGTPTGPKDSGAKPASSSPKGPAPPPADRVPSPDEFSFEDEAPPDDGPAYELEVAPTPAAPAPAAPKPLRPLKALDPEPYDDADDDEPAETVNRFDQLIGDSAAGFSLQQMFWLVGVMAAMFGVMRLFSPALGAFLAGVMVVIGMIVIALADVSAIVQLTWWALLAVYLLAAGFALSAGS